jgi:hypothetical protein
VGENGEGLRAAISRILARGAEENPYEPPQKRSWAEKVTDDSNAWLLARRLETDGDLARAAAEYARDKEMWLSRDHHSRAALSAACAARCMSRLEVNGGTAFKEAGRLYMEAAQRALSVNPPNALQLFERADECYKLSGDEGASKEAARYCVALRGALDITSGLG